MERRSIITKLLVIGGIVAASLGGCNKSPSNEPESSSGVARATASVATGSDGLTVEQRNIKKRYDLENVPGSIKHLYVISAYSGQVLIYSTVQGKVTSSGKRLTPYEVVCSPSDTMSRNLPSSYNAIPINIGGMSLRTQEVLQDDGTYGSSIEYLYWFDAQGRYHQHYVQGGQIVHVSDQPLAVKSIVLNMEAVNEN